MVLPKFSIISFFVSGGTICATNFLTYSTTLELRKKEQNKIIRMGRKSTMGWDYKVRVALLGNKNKDLIGRTLKKPAVNNTPKQCGGLITLCSNKFLSIKKF